MKFKSMIVTAFALSAFAASAEIGSRYGIVSSKDSGKAGTDYVSSPSKERREFYVVPSARIINFSMSDDQLKHVKTAEVRFYPSHSTAIQSAVTCKDNAPFDLDNVLQTLREAINSRNVELRLVKIKSGELCIIDAAFIL